MSRSRKKTLSNVKAPTISEWISAFNTSLLGSSDEMTTAEICDLTGQSKDTVHRRLRKLLRQGRLIIGRKITTNMIGNSVQTPCYRLKDVK